MKRVYEAQNPTDAHLLKDILETQDIEAIVKGELLWAARGETPDCPSVWVVNDEDYEEAMQVMREYLSKGKADKSIEKEWKCKKCGEIVEEQFSECWQCGTERSQGREE
jgi:hypothetical protein